jgi:hypothetical protein
MLSCAFISVEEANRAAYYAFLPFSESLVKIIVFCYYTFVAMKSTRFV